MQATTSGLGIPRLRMRELKVLLRAAIPARQPVLIVGEPGIGKTAGVKQVVAELDYDAVLSHPALDEPTDVKGVPAVVDGVVDFRPIGQVKRVLESTRNTAWILDDLGQALDATQAAYMQPLHGREFAGHRLPDHVSMIACTNGRTHRAGVRALLEPVKSRFLTIVELVADVEDFCEHWTQPENAWMPHQLVAYMRLRGYDMLSKFEPTADMTNSPNPRTWENAGRILTYGLPRELEAKALYGAVGQSAGTDLLAFLRLYDDLPQIQAILDDPANAPIPTSPNVLYAVSTALAAMATKQTFRPITQYAERLVDGGNGEFAALLINDAIRRKPEVVQTKDYVRVATGALGDLLTGRAA